MTDLSNVDAVVSLNQTRGFVSEVMTQVRKAKDAIKIIEEGLETLQGLVDEGWRFAGNHQ